MKHVKSINEAQENMDIRDITKSLSDEELKMVEKGKKHWSMEALNRRSGGYVDSETIKDLIDKRTRSYLSLSP